MHISALPSQYLGSEWRCKSIYCQSCSLGLHTTVNTTSMVVSKCHIVRLLTCARVIVSPFYVMVLQTTMGLTGAVLVLWNGVLLLLTQSKEISCYRTAGTGTSHSLYVAALTTLKLYHRRIFVNSSHKWTVFFFPLPLFRNFMKHAFVFLQHKITVSKNQKSSLSVKVFYLKEGNALQSDFLIL